MKIKSLPILICVCVAIILPADNSAIKTLSPDLYVQEQVQKPPKESKNGFESIQAEQIESYLSFLASDVTKGRLTASDGMLISSQYIASMLKKMNIKPAGDKVRPAGNKHRYAPSADQIILPQEYFQTIPLKEITAAESMISIHWKSNYEKQWLFYSDIGYHYTPSDSLMLKAPLAFAGYGIIEPELDVNDYAKMDVNEKIVMILNDTPAEINADSPFNKKEFKSKFHVSRHNWYSTSEKIKIAKDKGALAVLVIENPSEKNMDIAEQSLHSQHFDEEHPTPFRALKKLALIDKEYARPKASIPVIFISRTMAAEILAEEGKNLSEILEKLKTSAKSQSFLFSNLSLSIKTTVSQTLTSCRNVLGIVEGTDPQLKDEFIVVCAHLDHLGTFERYVYNGANDNGSGAAALLEIAEAFSANPLKPKRSILFAFWTGEELGFLGSSYYTLHPAYPLEKTKAVLNMDMIGLKWTAEAIKLSQNWLKYDDYDSFSAQLKGKPFLSPIIGTSCTDLNNALKDNNQYVDFAMYIRKTHEAGGSDQYPFSLKNINWMVIYGCMPEFYHQPADHLEKVDLPYVEKIARLVYLTAFQLANQ